MAKGTTNGGCRAKASARACARGTAAHEYTFAPICHLHVRIVGLDGEPCRSLRFVRAMNEPTIEEGRYVAMDMMIETDFRLGPFFSGVAPDALHIHFRDLVAGEETDELVEWLYELGWADDR